MIDPHPSRWRRLEQRLGFHGHRNLFWSCRQEMNFGDWIGPILFEKLSGRDPIYCLPTQLYSSRVYFTVGSILHRISRPDVVEVWGSGIIRADAKFHRPKIIRAVRGPLSRDRCLQLGYDCPEVYGDPALLMPIVYHPKPKSRAMFGVVPHFVNKRSSNAFFAVSENVRTIDVQRPVCDVINDIASCEIVVSSSLHGIIVAHAYGIPAVRLILSEALAGDGVKFRDYEESFGTGFRIAELEAVDFKDADNLLDEAREKAIAPDVTSLQKELLASCPFNDSRVKI